MQAGDRRRFENALNEANTERKLGLTILPAKDHAEAFLMVETGRAVAFVMDDILLFGKESAGVPPEVADACNARPWGGRRCAGPAMRAESP